MPNRLSLKYGQEPITHIGSWYGTIKALDFTFCYRWCYFSKLGYYIDLVIDLSTNSLHMAVKLQILINVVTPRRLMLSVTSFNAVDMKTKSVISISQHHCLIFVWVWYDTIHTKPMVSFEKTKMAFKSRF